MKLLDCSETVARDNHGLDARLEVSLASSFLALLPHSFFSILTSVFVFDNCRVSLNEGSDFISQTVSKWKIISIFSTQR